MFSLWSTLSADAINSRSHWLVACAGSAAQAWSGNVSAGLRQITSLGTAESPWRCVCLCVTWHEFADCTHSCIYTCNEHTFTMTHRFKLPCRLNMTENTPHTHSCSVSIEHKRYGQDTYRSGLGWLCQPYCDDSKTPRTCAAFALTARTVGSQRLCKLTSLSAQVSNWFSVVGKKDPSKFKL